MLIILKNKYLTYSYYMFSNIICNTLIDFRPNVMIFIFFEVWKIYHNFNCVKNEFVNQRSKSNEIQITN